MDTLHPLEYKRIVYTSIVLCDCLLMINNAFLLTLQHYEDIAPYTRHFTFLSDRPISFLPGQFITLHWRYEDKRVHRNYSLANYGGYNPDRSNRVELAATYVPHGFASEQLFAMQPGNQIEATGAFGRLILRDEPVKRYLLIATGTGITPYRTMLSNLAGKMATDPELQVLLLFGVRHSQDVLYRNELTTFANQQPQFTLQIYYSREPYPTLAYEHSGYVTKALNDKFQVFPDRDIAYLCGHPGMVDDVYRLLSEKGLSNDRIRREKYISPKLKIRP